MHRQAATKLVSLLPSSSSLSSYSSLLSSAAMTLPGALRSLRQRMPRPPGFTSQSSAFHPPPTLPTATATTGQTPTPVPWLEGRPHAENALLSALHCSSLLELKLTLTAVVLCECAYKRPDADVIRYASEFPSRYPPDLIDVSGWSRRDTSTFWLLNRILVSIFPPFSKALRTLVFISECIVSAYLHYYTDRDVRSARWPTQWPIRSNGLWWPRGRTQSTAGERARTCNDTESAAIDRIRCRGSSDCC